MNFRYFEAGTPDAALPDLDAVAEGAELARDLLESTGMIPAGVMRDVPKTREAVRDYVRDNAWGHHASCTCPMGPSDPMGVDAERFVLDSKFRVRGAQGLRVVDASIFPKIPGLFIVTAIYMASEKAADVIPRIGLSRRRASPPALAAPHETATWTPMKGRSGSPGTRYGLKTPGSRISSSSTGMLSPGMTSTGLAGSYFRDEVGG